MVIECAPQRVCSDTACDCLTKPLNPRHNACAGRGLADSMQDTQRQQMMGDCFAFYGSGTPDLVHAAWSWTKEKGPAGETLGDGGHLSLGGGLLTTSINCEA